MMEFYHACTLRRTLRVLVGMKPSISSTKSGAVIEKCVYLIELQKS